MNQIHTFVAYKVIDQNVDKFKIWHNRLSHPHHRDDTKIYQQSCWSQLKSCKILKSSDLCAPHVP
jgi:hypothetical protein